MSDHRPQNFLVPPPPYKYCPDFSHTALSAGRAYHCTDTAYRNIFPVPVFPPSVFLYPQRCHWQAVLPHQVPGTFLTISHILRLYSGHSICRLFPTGLPESSLNICQRKHFPDCQKYVLPPGSFFLRLLPGTSLLLFPLLL